jgi:hypothetical protein
MFVGNFLPGDGESGPGAAEPSCEQERESGHLPGRSRGKGGASRAHTRRQQVLALVHWSRADLAEAHRTQWRKSIHHFHALLAWGPQGRKREKQRHVYRHVYPPANAINWAPIFHAALSPSARSRINFIFHAADRASAFLRLLRFAWRN